MTPKTYVFKVLWRATSISLKVRAKNYDAALKMAESQVMRMEGGNGVMGIEFIEEREI